MAKAAKAVVETAPEDVERLSAENFAALKASLRDPPADPPPEASGQQQEQQAAEDAKQSEEQEKATREAEAAAAAAAADQAAADAAAEDDDAVGTKQETVPHGRWHHTNERRKEAERKAAEAEKRAAEEREKFIRLETRTQALLEMQRAADEAARQQAGGEKKPPTKEEDPLAYLDYVEQRLNKVDSALTERQKADEAQAQLRDMYAAYQIDMRRYAQERPEIVEAVNYLADARRKELTLFGVTDPAAQTQDLNQLEQNIISYALNARRSPAELLHEIAKQRGFVAKPAAAATNGAGSQHQPVNGRAVAEQVARQEQTKEAAKSLGASSGRPTQTEEVTPDQILNMTDEEFSAFKTKFGLRKAFGV